jgi:serine/threonine protein kinase
LPKAVKIDGFHFETGRILGNKYEILSQLGAGWEAEVYLLKELETGIERAGKFFFPHRNVNNKAVKFYAKKLHKLRDCPVLIQYLTQEKMTFKGHSITYLVSEFVEGEMLDTWMQKRKGKRLTPYMAAHLLHEMARGMESVHALNEYHGDLHSGNIMIRRVGIRFDIKMLDVIHWWGTRPENIKEDVFDLVRIFYDVIGGKKYYASQPAPVKEICCGLKRSLISRKFTTAGKLRRYLETMNWLDAS